MAAPKDKMVIADKTPSPRYNLTNADHLDSTAGPDKSAHAPKVASEKGKLKATEQAENTPSYTKTQAIGLRLLTLAEQPHDLLDKAAAAVAAGQTGGVPAIATESEQVPQVTEVEAEDVKPALSKKKKKRGGKKGSNKHDAKEEGVEAQATIEEADIPVSANELPRPIFEFQAPATSDSKEIIEPRRVQRRA